MKHLILVIALAVAPTVGCSRQQESHSSSAGPTSDHYVLNSKSREMYNETADERLRSEARVILVRLRESLPEKSDAEILRMLKEGVIPETGKPIPKGYDVEYYVRLYGARLIEWELRKRPSAKSLLIAQKGNFTEIFTGDNGMPATVEAVCEHVVLGDRPLLYDSEVDLMP